MILNNVTGDFYVGSAVDIRGRWRSHLSCLRNGKNAAPILQNAWAKYGEDAFSFQVLETVEDRRDAVPKEQKYLDLLKPKYNVCPVAGSPLGRKHSEETKRKMGEARRGPKNVWFGVTGEAHPCFGRPNTPEQRALLAEKHSGAGNPMFGKTPTHAKLTPEQVREIRFLISLGYRHRELRPLYGLSASNVSQIKHRRAYREVI